MNNLINALYAGILLIVIVLLMISIHKERKHDHTNKR